MKFMLMMHARRGGGDWDVMSWPPKAIQGHIAYMQTLYTDPETGTTATNPFLDDAPEPAPGPIRPSSRQRAAR